MPRLESDERHQDALLFPMSGVDNYGEWTVSSVWQELKVRWLPTKTQSTDAKGNPITIDATVIVDCDVTIGSVMWLGSRDDISGTSDPPLPETDLMKVVKFDKVPDLKGRNFHRTVSLSRISDTMPTFL